MELQASYQDAVTYTPGDSEELNGEILTLMRAGKKTATCADWAEFGAGREALPVVGRVDVALDWNGRPACATRTVVVERIRFCDMSEERVVLQGEFRDLADWREGYARYLTKNGTFDPEMDLMFEVFERVEDFADV